MIKYFLVKKGKIYLRVISGERKGHKLKAPKGREVRPTEDKIKESLFNILRPLKLEAVVLDLFGGSGGIGIEFLSRGAKTAYFVDVSNDSIKTIKENLLHTKLIDKSIILNMDALRAINFLKEKSIAFDYIYLDPPFKNHELLFKVLDSISKNNLLSAEGIMIIEHEKELTLEVEINSFYKYDFRSYGSKGLSFFRNKEV